MNDIVRVRGHEGMFLVLAYKSTTKEVAVRKIDVFPESLAFRTSRDSRPFTVGAALLYMDRHVDAVRHYTRFNLHGGATSKIPEVAHG